MLSILTRTRLVRVTISSIQKALEGTVVFSANMNMHVNRQFSRLSVVHMPSYSSQNTQVARNKQHSSDCEKWRVQQLVF